MIKGMTEEEFGEAIHTYVRPAKPIDTLEFLKGRQKELDEIRRALFADGRHIFIYGDRGVGKSSLAQTAAFIYQSSDAAIIQAGCVKQSTFLSIIEGIAKDVADKIGNKETSFKASLNLKIITFEHTEKSSPNVQKPITTMEDALDVISDIRKVHSQKPIIVIDEFDAIADKEERYLFAEFLKKMGDSGVYVPIIFSGIAASFDDLLGGHLSSIRQLKPIRLEPISWDSRWDILIEALEAFQIEFDDEIKYRVAGISDGYPYYVHLITEQLLWKVFDDPNSLNIASHRNYLDALKSAVESVEELIRKPYDTATLRHSQDFHHVIWAAADSTELHRNIDSMYMSYQRIIRDLNKIGHGQEIPAIPRNKFAQRLSTLTKASHGCVLKKMTETRTGWYQFSENMLRGYVRLLAETNGIQLWTQEAAAPRQLINPRTQHQVSRHRYSSSIPAGVRLRDDEKSEDQ